MAIFLRGDLALQRKEKRVGEGWGESTVAPAGKQT